MSVDKHIARIKNTWAFALANLDDGQTALLTDEKNEHIHRIGSDFYFPAMSKKWTGAAFTFLDSAFNDLEIKGNLDIAEFLRHTGDLNTYLQFQTDRADIFAGALNFLQIQNTTQNVFNINPTAADVDTRISATGATNALFVQGSDGLIGVGTASPITVLHLASTGPSVATLERVDATISINNQIGGIDFRGGESTIQTVGQISVNATANWDATNSPTYMTFSTTENSLILSEKLRITSNGIVANNALSNFDFIIKSDTNANFFHLDADGGIGSEGSLGIGGVPVLDTRLSITDVASGSSTATSLLTLDDSSNNGIIQFLGGATSNQTIIFRDNVGTDAGIAYNHSTRELGLFGPGDVSYITMTATEIIMNTDGLDKIFRVEGDGDVNLIVTKSAGAADSNFVGIGVAPTLGKLQVKITGDGDEGLSAGVYFDQDNTGNLPVLGLDQGDSIEAFIDYIGTSNPSAVNSISSWTTGQTIQGLFKVEINGVTRWMQFFDAPTA